MKEYTRIKILVEDKTGIKDISTKDRYQDNVKARYLYFKLCLNECRESCLQRLRSSLVATRKV